ncbi:hypothetical protein MLD38_020440 [Melastoma candidum]|uniref:Uncharacterized protein n=1 Tax=Melastoma candidum TaxID=119954 RepID=A0ACB9QET0_9MYRT|nr:hypothetical protein MLD38_020440 [Melastoma candidum]
MASGKYSRIDNKKSSSNYCTTVSIIGFVALCLVGVWMLTSSSVTPAQKVQVAQETGRDEVKGQVAEISDEAQQMKVVPEQGNDDAPSKEKASQQFEDSPGDLPEDATKGDTDEKEKSSLDDQEEKPEVKTEETQTTEDDSTSKSSEGELSQTKGDDSTGQGESDQGSSETSQGESQDGSVEGKTETYDGEKKSEAEEVVKGSEETSEEAKSNEKVDEGQGQTEEKANQSGNEESVEKKDEQQTQADESKETFPSGAQSELLKETTTQNGAFSTQAAESKEEKESRESPKQQVSYTWRVCNVSAGADYIPCLDNLQAVRTLKTTKHYEHRERHCPHDPPTCLVGLPEGYKKPIEWPTSREKIWYYNVPHTQLAEYKGHQNWVKVSGEYLTFPGGGTQFQHGALHYIDFIQESVPDISWGNHTRVILDVGCGVASFGGFLFDRDVVAMSFAPKDEHEAQVQFALERGIPAISAVMGTVRLPFPSKVFDAIHCARCRVPWHIEGGKLLLELNRVLRPGGHFIWSATPVYEKLEEDVEIWKAMTELTKAMCWDLISINKDKLNGVAIATYRKPSTNDCYQRRSQTEPPLCRESDDPNAAWNVTLQACMHKIPAEPNERGSQWPEQWPERLVKTPYWLLSSQVGVYGKPAPEDFNADTEHWQRVVTKSYLTGIGIDWSSVRNVMDMRAVYGGFAAALKDMNVWVMNVISIDAPDTLPIIYERGLFGIYHDWCESFSTYPRTYDLLHADHLFSRIKKRCNLKAVVAEVDRILRPEGKLFVRDNVETINEVENMVRSMQWEVRLTYSKDKEGLLCVQKSIWRPSESETLSYAIE